MKPSRSPPADAIAKTRAAYLWTSLLTTPFWVIFNMLPFILYKDLHATPTQIALLVTLKPTVSLLSGYWSAAVNKRRDRLVSNVIWARVLSHLPFLFFPFINNVWLYIAAFGLYMALHRGVVPAWMEILKINIPTEGREKVFVWGSFVGYAGNALLPFTIGYILDDFPLAWRWIFPAAALVALSATFFKKRIPIMPQQEEAPPRPTRSWKEIVVEPWTHAAALLKARPDFLRYQIGFMLGGGGIMLMQPILPTYFVDTLQLSYTEMAVALSLCKGMGFAITSPLWSRYMNRINIYRLSSLPPLCICGFAACLLAAQWEAYWVYAAYIFYGCMQAGSEMVWHLSGPTFAQHEDSSTYSSVNVLAVGVRGSVIPPLGSLLYMWSNPLTVIVLGGAVCLGVHYYLIGLKEKEAAHTPA